jgi:glycosyltransferase involved in cell wall biosynthesis
MWAARRLSLPVVASYHTDVPGYARRWGWGVLHQPLWAAFRWIHNQADLNLCPSQWTLNELKAQKFDHLKVWTRGVDTVQFQPRYRTKHWREWLSKGHPYSPLLLYVGRLSREKRVDWLLTALESTPNARLAIVGDGPDRERLEDLFAGTHTVFTGYLHGRDLAHAYAAADVFVFPSANETLGNVVLEAMASGLPVVTARSGGPLDIIFEGETGLMFDPDSKEELVTAVHHLIHDSHLAERIGKAARAYAESRSWEQVLDRLLEDYQELIQKQTAVLPPAPTQNIWFPNLFV